MVHSDFSQPQVQDNIQHAVHNGLPPPNFSLPLPDNPETITASLLLQIGQTPNPRHKFIYQVLVKHLHAFVKESSLSTEEWLAAIQFLTRTGQSARPEFMMLSDAFGVSALVDSLNNPVDGGATENSVLGPFHTDDTEDIEPGSSIASEGKGEYLFIEGRVLATDGAPIADALVDLWEADQYGLYDLQYADKTRPDCRGRLRSARDGSFSCRAVQPMAYPGPYDGPAGELLLAQGRHNMRPNHIHVIVEAPGYHRLVTAFYPDGDKWLTSDPVFGVKKSLIVKLEQVNDDVEARKRGFPKGGSFKLLRRDIVLLTEEYSRKLRQQLINETEASCSEARAN